MDKNTRLSVRWSSVSLCLEWLKFTGQEQRKGDRETLLVTRLNRINIAKEGELKGMSFTLLVPSTNLFARTAAK